MIWSDVTDTTAGDFIHIKRCQLELGTSATPFEFRPFQQELALCRRYARLIANTTSSLIAGARSTTTQARFTSQCESMRSAPALSSTPTFTSGGAGAGQFSIYDYVTNTFLNITAGSCTLSLATFDVESGVFQLFASVSGGTWTAGAASDYSVIQFGSPILLDAEL
jgi:hypothetical protein